LQTFLSSCHNLTGLPAKIGNLITEIPPRFGRLKSLAVNPSNFLVELDKKLSEEYADILEQEEELWSMKARLNWKVQGDCNTSFFHVSTLVRRKSNKIFRLKNAVGEWLDSEALMKEHILNSFKDLYCSQHSSSIPSLEGRVS
jgi:hypothetical protein